MAKKEKRENKENELKENGEESGSKALTIVFAILTVIIWLAIFAVLIKLDFGGFGSKVLRPVLKDIPVINKILPEPTDEEILEENNYKFNNLSEAIEYIKELELELANYQQAQGTDGEMIAELRQEIERLRVFEANQAAFEQEKEQYYNEVVLGNGDQVASDFARWYENIDSATAEEIYRQVIEKEKSDQQLQDYVLAFSKMDAQTAALIFQEMTGDLDTVIKILNTMDAKNRSAILSALAANDAVYAAKITQLLAP